ncbi:MAG: hypothetical protein CSA62_12265 [Planctomycetota bacterium]|nr:MAG: hypothetical protein CSA62_12265 [Planctomycetota bacterium]
MQERSAVAAAKALWERGSSRAACARLRKLVDKEPSHPARLQLLDYLLQDGRPSEALHLIRSQRATWSEDLQVLYRQAIAEHLLGEYSQARHSYQRIAKIGADKEAWLRIAESGLAGLDREQELRERAESARGRAGLLAGLGGGGLFLFSGLVWVLARRMKRRCD